MQTTSFLLSNLHCPSCVSNIENALFALHPKPLSVSASIVSSWVTVRHDLSLSPITLRDALEDAGFEVINVTVDDSTQSELSLDTNGSSRDIPLGQGIFDHAVKRWSFKLLRNPSNRQYMRMRERHIEVCALCRTEELRAATEKKSPKDDAESNRAFVVVDKDEKEDLWRASLAVGGMTCASCVNTIKEELEGKEWIRKVDINLIMNSASIDIVGKDHANELVDMIEDMGFEAALDNVTPIQDMQTPPLNGKGSNMEDGPPQAQRRTIQIKVTGMFCDRCPERIIRCLDTFETRGVQIEKALSVKDPILKISYTPHAPDFTIRHIMETLANVDITLVPSIYHPPSLEERSRILHAQERRAILNRVALCVFTAIPTFIIGIVYMSLISPANSGRVFLDGTMWAGVSRAQWALFFMATPVYFLAADVFHRRTLKEIRSMWRRSSKTPILQRFYRFGSMDMLISLGTSIAYFSSVAQIIASGVHPSDMASGNSFYFDSVVFLTMFLLIGRLIEAFSKARTGDAVAMLGKLRPTEAILWDKETGSNHQVNVDLLEFGDVVRVLHGASPPNDGTVVQGETSFDESSLTGESKLVKKVIGDQVYSGTINKGSPISVEITGVSGTSMIDRIIEVVREGQTRHAPIERIADKLTGYFVPLVTLVAVSTWLIWLGLGLSGRLPNSYLDTSSGGWTAWSLQFAIAVFVVACPCGLGLAAPTALFVGGGLAAKHGILVKGGGEAFERASRLDCIVFDKTGTLTMGGEPVVTDHMLLPGTVPEKIIFSMVRKLEENSSHPIAKAIVTFCQTQGKEAGEVQDVAEIAGKGLKGVYEAEEGNTIIEVIIGNEPLMEDHLAEITHDTTAVLDAWKRQGKSVALVATRPKSTSEAWRISALFGISDEIRPEAAGVVRALQKRGTAVWMLSGDNYDSACAIGAQVGIARENIIAGVLPSQKADKIQYLQKSLRRRNRSGKESSEGRALVAMVGDGINDSPALTAADVGIAIGSGSDIAISSASFVLVSSNLNALITLLDLSRIVFNRIKFNFGWALVYNLIGVPVAAGVLYPIVSNGNHVRLDPVWASLAMALSSISVVCSSLALRSGIPGIGFRGRKR
jgi:Cu+-exporting ATPase